MATAKAKPKKASKKAAGSGKMVVWEGGVGRVGEARPGRAMPAPAPSLSKAKPKAAAPQKGKAESRSKR